MILIYKLFSGFIIFKYLKMVSFLIGLVAVTSVLGFGFPDHLMWVKVELVFIVTAAD